jgi:membrane protein YqaA with SNARE-associated domain
MSGKFGGKTSKPNSNRPASIQQFCAAAEFVAGSSPRESLLQFLDFPGVFSQPMGRKNKIFAWLQGLVLAFGGGGLFVVTFFDSSVLSFPFFPDAVLIQLCVANPARMPYYAAMAALGSLCGCLLLYGLAKKGGEAFFHKHARGKAEVIKEWVEKNAFLSAFVPALLPPPFPFKPFVLAEGVFQVPWRTFVIAILLGRGLRYGGEGLLAVRYGDQALPFLKAHGAAFAVSVVVVLVLLYGVSHFVFRKPAAKV